MDEAVYRLMEREINTMRLISANRQALQQALYINQMRYIKESKREEERLQETLSQIRTQRSERLWSGAGGARNWLLLLDGEERQRYEQLHKQLIEWEQKLSHRSHLLDRQSDIR